MAKNALNLAAVGDLHYGRAGHGAGHAAFAYAAAHADVLLLCGDLTDYGQPEEAHVLARDLGRVLSIPVLAVLGNHDFEAGKEQEVARILSDAGVVVLDGTAFEVEGVGFVGVKGFAGGFGRRLLEPWGEPSIKSFVREAIDEALKLESALAKLRTRRRVVLLHYAPIEATVAGEPHEIFPFLGSSRLEDPLNRWGVDMVFHGHAHRGALEGRTHDGVPVYNVAAPLLRRVFPDQPPVRIVTLPLVADDADELGASGDGGRGSGASSPESPGP